MSEGDLNTEIGEISPCLLEHLATLTRDQVRFVGTRAAVPVLAEPTSTQW